MIVTFYRCYWPAVYEFLKPMNLANCVQETFGHMLSLKLDEGKIKEIYRLLPAGAIIEVVPEFGYNKELLEIEDILKSYGVADDN